MVASFDYIQWRDRPLGIPHERTYGKYRLCYRKRTGRRCRFIIKAGTCRRSFNRCALFGTAWRNEDNQAFLNRRPLPNKLRYLTAITLTAAALNPLLSIQAVRCRRQRSLLFLQILQSKRRRCFCPLRRKPLFLDGYGAGVEACPQRPSYYGNAGRFFQIAEISIRMLKDKNTGCAFHQLWIRKRFRTAAAGPLICSAEGWQYRTVMDTVDWFWCKRLYGILWGAPGEYFRQDRRLM